MKKSRKISIRFNYHPEISYNDYDLKVYIDGSNLCEFKVGDKIEYDTSNIEFLADWFEYNLKFIINYDKFPLDIEGENGIELRKKAYFIDDDENEASWFIEVAEWSERHLWTFSGLKMIFPDVMFRRVEEKIEISWDSRDKYIDNKYDIQFTNAKGVSFVEIKEFEEEVTRFIKDVKKVGETVRLKLMIPYIGETKLIYAEKEYNEPFSFEKEMLEDLERCGYITDSVYNLILMNENDRKLVPIIIKYIKLSFHDEEKIQLTRFLAVEGFIEAIRPLLDEFYKTKNKEYRIVICNTISIISNENLSEELIEIIKKREYGTSRKPLVYRLYKYKNREKVIEVLQNLLKDEDLKEYAEYSFNNLLGYTSKIYKCSIQ